MKNILLLLSIVGLSFMAFSCSDNDDFDDTEIPPDKNYEYFIGTWKVSALQKKNTTEFIPVDKAFENSVVFGKNTISIRIITTEQQADSKPFVEACDFTNHAYYTIEDGGIYGNSEKHTKQLVLKISSVDKENGTAVMVNRLTGSTYKISLTDTDDPGDTEDPGDSEDPGDTDNPGDTEDPGDDTDTPADKEYEYFTGTWKVTALRKKNTTDFVPVDKAFENTVVFGATSISVRITVAQQGGNPFVESWDFTGFEYFKVQNDSICSYNEKNEKQPVFKIISLDKENYIAVLVNQMTGHAYRITLSDNIDDTNNPGDTDNPGDNENPGDTEYPVDEDYGYFIGSWKITAVQKKNTTAFITVDNNFENSIVFGAHNITVRITTPVQPDGKPFVEAGDFTSMAYCTVEDNSIYGYSEKHTRQLLLTIISLDKANNTAVLLNDLTGNMYKITK